jgi:signal peptidase II
MNFGKKFFVMAIVLVSCIGCDQATKHIAKSSLASLPPQSYFNDFLRLQYAENPGGMMSFGAELPESVRFWFLTVFVGLLLVGILLYLLASRRVTPMQTTALSFVVAGGFSNLLDRLLHDGHVIDFLNVGLGSVRTAIFNLADVIILLGTFLLFISSTHKHQEQPIENGTHQA